MTYNCAGEDKVQEKIQELQAEPELLLTYKADFILLLFKNNALIYFNVVISGHVYTRVVMERML